MDVVNENNTFLAFLKLETPRQTVHRRVKEGNLRSLLDFAK